MHTVNETLPASNGFTVRAGRHRTPRASWLAWLWSARLARANAVRQLISSERYTGARESGRGPLSEQRVRPVCSSFDLSAGYLPLCLTLRGYDAMGETLCTMVATRRSSVSLRLCRMLRSRTIRSRMAGCLYDRYFESRRAVIANSSAHPDESVFFSVRFVGALFPPHWVSSTAASWSPSASPLGKNARGRRGANCHASPYDRGRSLGAHTVGLQVRDTNQPAMRTFILRLGSRPAGTTRF